MRAVIFEGRSVYWEGGDLHRPYLHWTSLPRTSSFFSPWHFGFLFVLSMSPPCLLWLVWPIKIISVFSFWDFVLIHPSIILKAMCLTLPASLHTKETRTALLLCLFSQLQSLLRRDFTSSLHNKDSEIHHMQNSKFGLRRDHKRKIKKEGANL